MKVKSDHRSKFSNLSNWKEEAWKNQGFNGIRTRDLRDTGAMLYHGNSTITLHWSYKLSASSPFAATFPATKLLVIFVLYRALFFHVVLCCAMLSNVVLWCSVLYNVGLSCCGVLDYYCTMLCYVVLCTMLYYGVWKYYCAEISFTVTVH